MIGRALGVWDAYSIPRLATIVNPCVVMKPEEEAVVIYGVLLISYLTRKRG